MTVCLAALNETIYQEEKKFLIEQYALRLLSLLGKGEEELDESTIEALLVARSQASPDLAERISTLLNIDSSGETALATQESNEPESASTDPTDADLQDDEEDEDEVEGLFDESDQEDEDEAEGLFDKGEEDSTNTEDEAEGLFDKNKETSINTASEDTEASPIDQTKPKARKELKKAGKKKRLQGEQNEDAGVLFGNNIYSGNEGGHQQEEAGQFEAKEGHQQEETGQFEAKEGHQQEETGKFEAKEGHQQEETGKFEAKEGHQQEETGKFEAKEGHQQEETGKFEAKEGHQQKETGQFEAKEGQSQKEKKEKKGEKKVVKADEILAGSKAAQAPETTIETTKSKIGQRPEATTETPSKDNKSYSTHTDELAKRKEDEAPIDLSPLSYVVTLKDLERALGIQPVPEDRRKLDRKWIQKLNDPSIQQLIDNAEEMQRPYALIPRLPRLVKDGKVINTTLVTMLRSYPQIFEDAAQIIKYRTEAFFTKEIPELDWVVVSCEILPNSADKNYVGQRPLIKEYAQKFQAVERKVKRRTLIEALYDVVIINAVKQTHILSNTVDLTDSRAGRQNQVCINFGEKGIRVNDVGREQKHPQMGICPSW